MSSALQVYMDGQAVEADFYDRYTSIQIEENADGPGSLLIRLPVAATPEGQVSSIDDPEWQPLKSIVVLATPEGGETGCIFDGFIVSQKLHMESGLRGSWVEVYAQDATLLMTFEEKTREWVNSTDASAANAIFQEYGFSPDPKNSDDDSGSYTEENHTLMQRGTDLEFLRGLSRRSGRMLRVVSGSEPGKWAGVFAKPDLKARPVLALRPNDPFVPNVSQLEFEWDVVRPTAVTARQSLFNDSSPDGASGDASESGLPTLATLNLATFTGRPMTVMLTTPADDAGQLRRKSEAVLREAQWFVRCTGEVDLAGVHVLLRAGDIASVETAGSRHSGDYLVWSVRHQITPEAHKMSFTLARNAMGPGAGEGGPFGGISL